MTSKIDKFLAKLDEMRQEKFFRLLYECGQGILRISTSKN